MEQEPEFRGKEPPHACSVYRQTDTDIVSICLRRLRRVVCCSRSKPLTNRLPEGDDGVHCFTGRPKAFLRSLHHQDDTLTSCLSTNPVHQCLYIKKNFSFPPTFTNYWQLVQKFLSCPTAMLSHVFLQYYYI